MTRTDIPTRLDRLPWSAWHWRVVIARHEAGDVLCVFNFSADPQVFAHPTLAEAELLLLRAGDADLRGESVGLSPYAACFLRRA